MDVDWNSSKIKQAILRWLVPELEASGESYNYVVVSRSEKSCLTEGSIVEFYPMECIILAVAARVVVFKLLSIFTYIQYSSESSW